MNIQNFKIKRQNVKITNRTYTISGVSVKDTRREQWD
jgi:hypothetical protein